ncbi:hypothetical protein SAMN05660464_0887 [Geodermatophilus dictyosporus]|uniref:Uncharacterized protein n=1 Tax=Geodermatophilus dictyosporus TaxID=1523247 RepID=A0A1I5JMY2_9ACTN|nr:hypothetical protein [Geodermatophilus dictyosporus]SFO74162.1 hypothetical protein SAMN05660464_0887 [Geodermatophilus dictyosporus]
MQARTVWGVVWIVVGLAVSIGGMVLAVVDPGRALQGGIGFGVGILPFVAGLFLVRHALPEGGDGGGRPWDTSGSFWDLFR